MENTAKRVRRPILEASEEVLDALEGIAFDLTIEDIAELHGVSLEVLQEQLEKGIQVELEHTKDADIAAQIAKDHLLEFPDYYDRLETIENLEEPEEGTEVALESIQPNGGIKFYLDKAGHDISVKAVASAAETYFEVNGLTSSDIKDVICYEDHIDVNSLNQAKIKSGKYRIKASKRQVKTSAGKLVDVKEYALEPMGVTESMKDYDETEGSLFTQKETYKYNINEFADEKAIRTYIQSVLTGVEYEVSTISSKEWEAAETMIFMTGTHDPGRDLWSERREDFGNLEMYHNSVLKRLHRGIIKEEDFNNADELMRFMSSKENPQYISEAFKEEQDENYVITIDFLKGFYEQLPEYSETLEDLREFINVVEDVLYDEDAIFYFDYVGQKNYDFVSNKDTFEACQKAVAVLNEYFSGQLLSSIMLVGDFDLEAVEESQIDK